MNVGLGVGANSLLPAPHHLHAAGMAPHACLKTWAHALCPCCSGWHGGAPPGAEWAPRTALLHRRPRGARISRGTSQSLQQPRTGLGSSCSWGGRAPAPSPHLETSAIFTPAPGPYPSFPRRTLPKDAACTAGHGMPGLPPARGLCPAKGPCPGELPPCRAARPLPASCPLSPAVPSQHVPGPLTDSCLPTPSCAPRPALPGAQRAY